MGHSLLARQLHRLGLDAGRLPTNHETWGRLLRQVQDAYEDADRYRYTSERSRALALTEVSAAAEARVASERDRLRMILGALGAGFLVMDEMGLVVSMNAEAERLLGRREGETIGQNGRSVLFGDEGDARAIPWSLGDGEIFREDSALARTAHGRPISISYAVTPIFVDDGRRGAGVVFQDVTTRDEKDRELRQQRQELAQARDIAEAASRAKSDFLASMSHEIRTPLNGILGLATLVLTEPLSPEQKLRMETLRHSGDSLLAIINDVMDAARLESRRLTLVCEPVDLVEVVETTVDLFHATAAEKGLGLAFGGTPGTPRHVTGEAGRVRQILSNLVGNAVKFTERGRISVRAETGGPGEVRICITDTGMGIRPEARARMFQMFSQADATTTRRFGGSGLGLAISKELALLMNGRIEFESAVGVGTTFVLTLPVEPAPPGAVPATWPTTLPAGSHIAACAVGATVARQLDAFAHANGIELVCAPFTGSRVPDVIVVGSEDGPTPDESRFLAELWPSVPRLILGGRLPTDRVRREADPPSLKVPAAALSPSRLAASIRHLAGLPGVPTRTRVYSNAFERKVKGPLKVLLVEDNPVNVLVAAGFLKRMDCAVETANNGRTAVELAARENFDLLLMDVHMPEVDGLEATRIIRETASARMVRIIGVSAATSPDEIQKCLDAGMDGFLSKPLQPSALRDALDSIARDIAGQPATAA